MPVPIRKVVGDDGHVLYIGGSDDAEQQAIIAALNELGALRHRRDEAVQKLEQAADTIKDFAWDWLDQFSSLPVPGSPNAGQAWGPLTTAQKAEALRDGVSALFLWGIRTAQALLLVSEVLQRLIQATDVDPPPDPA